MHGRLSHCRLHSQHLRAKWFYESISQLIVEFIASRTLPSNHRFSSAASPAKLGCWTASQLSMGEGKGPTLAKSPVPRRDNVERLTTTCTCGQFHSFSLEGGHARHRENMRNPHREAPGSQLGLKIVILGMYGRCQNCQSAVSF